MAEKGKRKRTAAKKAPTRRRVAHDGDEKIEEKDRERGVTVNVKATKVGEWPSGHLRHVGDEFEFEFPVDATEEEASLLPHWMEDVDGKVETAQSPSELNEA